MYRVACDALHLGDRCSKKGHTRGICDLCWLAFGSRTPETLAHLLLDCPFSAPVTQAAHRALIQTTSKVATAAVSRSLAALPSAAFTRTFKSRIIFGCLANDLNWALGAPPEAVVALAATVQHCLTTRRNANVTFASTPASRQQHSASHPQADPDDTLKQVANRLVLVAQAAHHKAAAEEKRLLVLYNSWLPDPAPLAIWERIWCKNGIMRQLY
jgi:hypothetical protein